MIFAPRPAVAFALMLGLAACSGTPAGSEPTEFEDLPTAASATATPAVVNPTASAPEATTAAPTAGFERPAEVTLTLAGTMFDEDGSYTASGPSVYCGNVQLNVTGNTRAFGFEFGEPDESGIENISFGADDLVPGSTTTTFYLSANVIAPVGGAGPDTIVQAGEPGYDDTGTASLSEANGTATLIVQGTNEDGGSMNMTVTCGPL